MYAARGSENNDLSEVYSYANTFGISRSAVNAKIAEKPFLRSRLIAWKYLLHSLFNTGYTPWLKGDSTAYIDTGVIPNDGDGLEYSMYFHTSSRCHVGSRLDYQHRAGAFCLGFVENNLLAINAAYETVPTKYATNTPVTRDAKHTFQLRKIGNNAVCLIDGVQAFSFSAETLNSIYPIYIFTWNNNNVPDNRRIGQADPMTYARIDNSNGEARWHGVPYFDNGEYGMLDLVSGNFYGSAVPNGLFSYELWDSNNNVVNIN